MVVRGAGSPDTVSSSNPIPKQLPRLWLTCVPSGVSRPPACQQEPRGRGTWPSMAPRGEFPVMKWSIRRRPTRRVRVASAASASPNRGSPRPVVSRRRGSARLLSRGQPNGAAMWDGLRCRRRPFEWGAAAGTGGVQGACLIFPVAVRSLMCGLFGRNPNVKAAGDLIWSLASPDKPSRRARSAGSRWVGRLSLIEILGCVALSTKCGFRREDLRAFHRTERSVYGPLPLPAPMYPTFRPHQLGARGQLPTPRLRLSQRCLPTSQRRLFLEPTSLTTSPFETPPPSCISKCQAPQTKVS